MTAMSLRSLETLFVRFRDGADGAALAAVFDACAPELFDVACHLVRDRSAAEDLVQTTFLTAIRRADRFDGKSPIKGWLYGILWREAAKLRRASARRVDPREMSARDTRDSTESAASAESFGPIDALERAELSSAIRRALDALPRTYREVLEPMVRDGSRPEDIARDLGRSPGTVRSQIHRGMKRMRRLLPVGLAPAPAFVGAPMRGLANVRKHVLTSAGVPHATAVSATTLTILGGAAMTKTILAGAAVFATAFAAGWFGRDLESADSRPQSVANTSSLASVAAESRSITGTVSETDGSDVEASSRRRVETSASTERTHDAEDAVRYWLARFNEKPDDWRHGLAVAGEIAKLPPDEALRIMTAVWPDLRVPVKEQAMKPFVFNGGHVHALRVLHLAATDSSLSVQGRAFTYLKDYAFRDFATDYAGYLTWAATYTDMAVGRVLAENAHRFVSDLLSRSAGDIAEAMQSIRRLNLETGTHAGVDLADEMRRSGALRLVETCLQSDDPKAKAAALEWSENVHPDEHWLRIWILPTIESPHDADPTMLSGALHVVARPDCGFARESILSYLRNASEDNNGAQFNAAQALAEIGDPASIPAMIEILVRDKTGKMNYAVGYYGLAKMTGVTWQKSYDGEWWLDWWRKNQGRFSAEVASIPIRR
jgi:RNA polymerase sigma-70 factor (ECF subfamily)